MSRTAQCLPSNWQLMNDGCTVPTTVLPGKAKQGSAGPPDIPVQGTEGPVKEAPISAFFLLALLSSQSRIGWGQKRRIPRWHGVRRWLFSMPFALKASASATS